MKIYSKYIKRCIDFLGSLILTPFILIITVIVGPFIYLEDKGSIFYKAKRRGVGGKIFEMYKFRSMKMNAPDLRNADNSTYNSPDDPRITKVGKIIRRTSIDELPQLINIIKGDMSIVGPRPLPVYETEQCNEYQNQRLLMKPGLTCYWQIQPNRNDISFDEWMALDLKYIEERSFLVDWKIIFMTFKAVVRKQGQ